jgi:hypothetical protein
MEERMKTIPITIVTITTFDPSMKNEDKLLI